MFLVRLQGKFDIDHSWKWKISAWRALDYSIGVNREFKQTGTATATWGARKRLFPYFWRLCSPAHSYLGPHFFRFCQRFHVWCTRFTTRATIRNLSWRMISMAFNFCMVRYSSMMTKYYFHIWIYFVVISINIRGMAKGYTCRFVSRMESFRLCRKLTDKLLVLKRNGSLDEKTYRKLRPQHKQLPRIYGLPKIHLTSLCGPSCPVSTPSLTTCQPTYRIFCLPWQVSPATQFRTPPASSRKSAASPSMRTKPWFPSMSNRCSPTFPSKAPWMPPSRDSAQIPAYQHGLACLHLKSPTSWASF